MLCKGLGPCENNIYKLIRWAVSAFSTLIVLNILNKTKEKYKVNSGFMYAESMCSVWKIGVTCSFHQNLVWLIQSFIKLRSCWWNVTNPSNIWGHPDEICVLPTISQNNYLYTEKTNLDTFKYFHFGHHMLRKMVLNNLHRCLRPSHSTAYVKIFIHNLLASVISLLSPSFVKSGRETLYVSHYMLQEDTCYLIYLQTCYYPHAIQ